jgi:hypothetical protein
MSKIEVDAIDKQSGSTLTLGGSGTAVTLACGATQTGFGREGSVNWQTSIKTATFTAASGEGYFCNTSGGAFTLTLPSSPSVGDIVALKDYAGNFATANLTIGRGGSNLDGDAQDSVRKTNNESLTLVYADATKGWLAVEEGTGYIGESFITATGGTETTSGDFKIHTFPGPGTFTVNSLGNGPNGAKVDYLVVAGGGSGGGVAGTGAGGTGGGGAGGTRYSDGTISGCYTAGPAPLSASALSISATAFPITVGGGAAASPNTGASGNSSTFSTITSAGGGGGGGWSSPTSYNATSGGSGGGGTYTGNAGSGNTPPTTPDQGTNGGAGNCTSAQGAGGGGGATVAGTAGGSNSGGPGGAGVTNAIRAPGQSYGGGGGGAVGNYPAVPGKTAGSGGTGGGASAPLSGGGVNATANTGGGGSGTENIGNPAPGRTGGAGGSGIVIIRYKFQ